MKTINIGWSTLLCIKLFFTFMTPKFSEVSDYCFHLKLYNLNSI